MSYTRFAIYYAPADGALASFGAAWLGWDLATGRPVERFSVPGLDAVTATPRKYGFHGTLKPPFRLAECQDLGRLSNDVAVLARRMPPARSIGLRLAVLDRFLALVPEDDAPEVARIAAACVIELDPFRAPPLRAELDRRRAAGLSPHHEALLLEWGYPYVLDEFRFHLTLTGRLSPGEIDVWRDHLSARLPALPQPFILDALTLVGEREDGRFEALQHYPLMG